MLKKKKQTNKQQTNKTVKLNKKDNEDRQKH